MRRAHGAAVLAATLGALAVAGAALADKEQIHLTAAGNKAARAAVVQRADLGSATGWTGGARKPNLGSSQTTCAGYSPKQSDLVVVGAAETRWKHAGLQFDSQAEVLRTPTMVRLDWKRSVLSSKVVPCLRQTVAKTLPASETLVSVKLLPFPRVATYTRAYRTLIDVKETTGSVRVAVDVVLVGRGSTEITLTTTALEAAGAVVTGAEARLARLLASRVTR